MRRNSGHVINLGVSSPYLCRHELEARQSVLD
jgi:hypothetical protein